MLPFNEKSANNFLVSLGGAVLFTLSCFIYRLLVDIGVHCLALFNTVHAVLVKFTDAISVHFFFFFAISRVVDFEETTS